MADSDLRRIAQSFIGELPGAVLMMRLMMQSVEKVRSDMPVLFDKYLKKSYNFINYCALERVPCSGVLFVTGRYRRKRIFRRQCKGDAVWSTSINPRQERVCFQRWLLRFLYRAASIFR